MNLFRYLLLGILFSCSFSSVIAQEVSDVESVHYQIHTIAPDAVLECGGLAFLPDDRLAVATRRGEIWIVEDWNTESPQATMFARGLHEPLGLAWHEGSLFTTQRSEVTRLTDRNDDGKADSYETVVSWPLTANYHEYSYGPEFLSDGSMLITLNVGWEGQGVSKSPFRGWMMQISQNGEMTPFAAGMRSPAGFGFNEEGDIFYAENQGDWVGSGRITHLEKGDFAGHPASLAWADDPKSPVSIRREEIHDDYQTMYEAAKSLDQLKLPAVWFPHSIMGISTSDIISIPEEGFGPFGGQLLVGDQGQSKIMRVFLEKVNGEYQGSCFPFREGFGSGILRMEWAPDGSLVVGMTSRGWASTGPEPFGLQRLSYTDATPFEIQKMEATEEGFRLTFTEAMDPEIASQPTTYQMQRFTYLYREAYGSPVTDLSPCLITRVEVENSTSVLIQVSGRKAGYIHELQIKGMKNTAGRSLLHDAAYYTLNHIPGQTHDHLHMEPVDLSSSDPDFDPLKHIVSLPASWSGQTLTELRISTLPGLRYDKKELSVPRGSYVKLEFVNPDDMQHNLVITRNGTSGAVGELALSMGLEAATNHYIPKTDDILYHTSLLEPDSRQIIYFRAPSTPGKYDYVCTVPGHATVMKGVLIVE